MSKGPYRKAESREQTEVEKLVTQTEKELLRLILEIKYLKECAKIAFDQAKLNPAYEQAVFSKTNTQIETFRKTMNTALTALLSSENRDIKLLAEIARLKEEVKNAKQA